VLGRQSVQRAAVGWIARFLPFSDLVVALARFACANETLKEPVVSPRLQGFVVFACLFDLSVRTFLLLFANGFWVAATWVVLAIFALSLCYAGTWASVLVRNVAVCGFLGVLLLALLVCGIHYAREQARRQSTSNILREMRGEMLERSALEPRKDD
jgi:hypothetical protein